MAEDTPTDASSEPDASAEATTLRGSVGGTLAEAPIAVPEPPGLVVEPPPEPAAAPEPAAISKPAPDQAAPPEAAAPKPRALISGSLRLEWHLARAPTSAARDASRSGLVIAHPMPAGTGSAAAAYSTFPELADRVAQDTGWAVLTFAFRGAGRSPGGFSPAGWLEDFRAAVTLLRADASSVWVAGFGLGGSLALRVAADDPGIGGVATLAAPADLAYLSADIRATATAAHEAGLIDSAAPGGLDGWAAQLRAIDPVGAAGAIPPRPLLIVHGSADETVSLVDARVLADASDGSAELRVVAMGGHRLRHDPRAVALLLGWLQRREN